MNISKNINIPTPTTFFTFPSTVKTRKSNLPNFETTISKYLSWMKDIRRKILESIFEKYEESSPRLPHSIVDSNTGSIKVFANIPILENVPKVITETGRVDNVQLIVVNVYSLKDSPIFFPFLSNQFSILGDKYTSPAVARIDN